MAILVGPDTKVIVQGMTGRAGTFYTAQMIDYGTTVVGGIRPGKGGQRHLMLPVFDKVSQAKAETEANASVVFVPSERAAAAMIEAIEAELDLVVCVTERIPVHDMLNVRAALKGGRTKLIGPNSQGVLAPGLCKLGVMSTVDAKKGPVGIVSRSASLTSEIVAQASAAGFGQSTTVGIGGDPIHGAGFSDCLELFMEDDDTRAIVLIGEIGGSDEEEAAAFLQAAGKKKLVIALVAGRHAPPERRMGHAGAFQMFRRGDAGAKIEALRESGAIIATDAQSVAPKLREVLTEKVS